MWAVRSGLIGSVLVVMAVTAAACSGTGSSSGGVDDTVTSTEAAVETTTTATTATTTTTEGSPPEQTTTTSAPADDTAADDTGQPDGTPDDTARTDLLTFAEGVLFVEQSGLPSGSAGTALSVIDGDARTETVTTDAQPPVTLVYKMPATTTFDRFAIPDVLESPGNATFVRSVVISGSLEGPDAGFEVLASVELETHDEAGQLTEIEPVVATPVRWVRIELAGGINIEEGDEGRTNLEFTEIIGNGSQESRALSTAFTGVWDFRITERLDLRGRPLELTQNGTTITGCLDTIVINGTVNGAIARATGYDPARNDRPSAFIFVADEDGSIQAVMSENNSRFNARTAVVDPDVTSSPCSEAPPEPRFCDVAVYVNFDVDSAVIRPESEQVLDDLYEGLVADGITELVIEGHTSTEGSAEHNLDLSERRARAVADALVARGLDPAGVSAVGKGETEPLLSPDDDESSRALNRRVEIACG